MRPVSRLDRAAVAAASAELEAAHPTDILARVLTTYGPRVAISTAFGVEGCALIHMAAQLDPAIEVFTVDTGLLFPETEELVQRFTARYGIRLRTFKPALTVAEQAERHGPELYARDPDRCCAMRKVEPTERALAGLDCWIAGLRRDQSQPRSDIGILEVLERADGSQLVKAHPLANWTRSDTWRYVLDHDVPYNPLLDRGYRSIGCWPCTRPVDPDGHERDGRWTGSSKTECGIHTFLIRSPR